MGSKSKAYLESNIPIKKCFTFEGSMELMAEAMVSWHLAMIGETSFSLETQLMTEERSTSMRCSSFR